MKKALILLVFLTSTTLVKAQVRLYGQYVAGDTREAVSKYERSMRLNGMYYYIEPHFGANDELYMVRIINHDFVVLSDYHVVFKHAERLVELMEHKYGPASRNKFVKETLICDIDTPYLIANWKMRDKFIQIDIECKDRSYYHIIFTISTYSLSTDKRSQLLRELVEN
jgi:hypothetical protein